MASYDKIRKKYLKKGGTHNTAHLFTDIEKYPEVQTWLKTVSSTTRTNYLRALTKFCNWCGKDPHGLIIERDRERDNPNPNERVGTRNLILDFRKFLEKKYAPATINCMDGAMRGFFSAVLGREGR